MTPPPDEQDDDTDDESWPDHVDIDRGTADQIALASSLWFVELTPPHPEVAPTIGLLHFPDHDGEPQNYVCTPPELPAILAQVEALEHPEAHNHGHGLFEVRKKYADGSIAGRFRFRADDWQAVVAFLRARIAKYRERAPLKSGLRPYYGDFDA